MIDSAALDATDILWNAGALVVAVVAIVLLFRGMQRPRLRLVRRDDGWRTTRRDVVLYALVAPLLVIFWVNVLSFSFVLAPTSLGGRQILLISCAVIVASRALAHVWHEPAHELAKSIPLTLLTLVLVGGALRPETAMDELRNELGSVDLSVPALLLLLFADYAFTAAWYWIGVRWLAGRGRHLPGVPRDPAPIAPARGAVAPST